MKTQTNPDGTVTVVAPGVYRMSELRSEAAQAFAELHERPVDWPTLVGQRQVGTDLFAATYALAGV